MSHIVKQIQKCMFLVFCLPAHATQGVENDLDSPSLESTVEIKVSISEAPRRDPPDIRLLFSVINRSGFPVTALDILDSPRTRPLWAKVIVVRDGSPLQRIGFPLKCHFRLIKLGSEQTISETLSLTQRFGQALMRNPGRYSILGLGSFSLEHSVAQGPRSFAVPIEPVSFELFDRDTRPRIRLLSDEPTLRVNSMIVFDNDQPYFQLTITNISDDGIQINLHDLPWVSTQSIHLLASNGIHIIGDNTVKMRARDDEHLSIASGQSVSGKMRLANLVDIPKRVSDSSGALVGWFTPTLYDANHRLLSPQHIPIPFTKIRFGPHLTQKGTSQPK